MILSLLAIPAIYFSALYFMNVRAGLEGLIDGTYERGTVAMARTSDPQQGNGGQFFIVDAKTSLPDPNGYTVFGKVVAGLDIVDRIVAEGAAGGNGATDGAPAAPISILRVAVTEKKA